MSALSKLGKVIGSGVGRASTSKIGLGLIGAGAFAAGFLNKTAPAVRDAAFQTAFDDPNADIAFLGRKLDSRYLAGRAIGGTTGTLLKASSGDYWGMENPIFPGQTLMGTGTGGAKGLGIGVGIGGALGGLVGGRKGMAVGAGIGGLIGGIAGLGAIPSATVMPVAGTAIGAVVGARKKGLKGALAGGALGALAGGAAGAATIGGSVAMTAMPVKGYIENNQRFFSESPYAGRTSGTIANSLNASGDIVLGMHNSRRGY